MTPSQTMAQGCPSPSPPPRLLDQVRLAARQRGHDERTIALFVFLYRHVLHLELGELPWPRPPRLLDQVHQVLRVRHYARSTEECYVQWKNQRGQVSFLGAPTACGSVGSVVLDTGKRNLTPLIFPGPLDSL